MLISLFLHVSRAERLTGFYGQWKGLSRAADTDRNLQGQSSNGESHGLIWVTHWSLSWEFVLAVVVVVVEGTGTDLCPVSLLGQALILVQ